MRLALIGREKLQALGQALVSEFDNLVARIRAGWNVEHNEEGGHGEVHAETVTTGRLVFSETAYVKIFTPITHNLNPPELSNAAVLRIEPDPAGPPDILITGLQVPQDAAGNVLDGRVLVLENFTENGKSIRIAQENSANGQGSFARNRFRIPWQPLALNAIAEFVIHPSSFVTLMYSAPKARWLIGEQRYDNSSAFMSIFTSQNDFAFGTSPRAMRTWRLIPEASDLWVSGFARDQLVEDEKKTLVNDGRYVVDLLHAYPGSATANRIYCPGGIRYRLHPRESVELQYIRGGTGGWRILLKADQWVDVPYSSANFLSSPAGLWAVTPGNAVTFAYQLDGNRMTVAYTLTSTTVSGAPTRLHVVIPEGRLSARTIHARPGLVFDGSGAKNGAVCTASANGYLLTFILDAFETPWAAGGVHLWGQITFMIGEDAAVSETHTDVAHADAAHADSEHNDVSHVDVAHVDTHSDTSHADSSHTDTIHQDVHSDTHSDVIHQDTHSDFAHVDVPHSDSAHNDVPSNPPVHQDQHFDTHGDRPHTDVPFNDTPFVNSHTDNAHADFHADEITNHDDAHNDQTHVDNHFDEVHGPPPHNDHADHVTPPPSGHWDFHSDQHNDGQGGSHSDTHFDSHGDSPTHTDQHGDSGTHGDGHDDIPHSDSHSDQGHGDQGHSDVSHQDAAHEDAHIDFASPGNPHTDVPHGDSHSDVVHGDSHGDVIHQDTHTDTHTDVAHLDTGHSDAAHTDGHNDAPFNDTTHVDVPHADTAHGDSAHQDVGLHTDAAHTDLLIMSIELQPLGVTCNIGCAYCYQEPMRIAGNERGPAYDLDAMKQAAVAEGVGQPDGRGNRTGFAVFGGEPLLLPLKDLEELFRWGVEEKGAAPGIQTNASLITDRHIALFKKYQTGVGVSLDGPFELNRTRRAIDGKDSTTDATTAKSQAAIERMLDEGISVSLIVTVSACNCGTDAKLGATIQWMLDLRDRGLKYLNLHTLEVDSDDGAALLLSTPRSIDVMRRLRRELVGFAQVSPFDDMRKTLLRESGSNCVWNHCDPLTTAAVRGIDGQGGRKNCGRTEKQGVSFMKSDVPGRERSLVLYLTPQEYGGCQGCRFFAACGGHCPGEGIDGDWRNRSIHCELLMALFTDLESELALQGLTPVSQSPRRALVEAQMLGLSGQTVTAHGDSPHGDSPHGDSHGDHTDTGRGK